MLENVGNSIMVGKYWKFIKFIILNLEVPINCPNREFTKFPSFFLALLGSSAGRHQQNPRNPLDKLRNPSVPSRIRGRSYGCGFFCYPVHIRTAGSTIQDPSFPPKNA